jgi:hypothetical protein
VEKVLLEEWVPAMRCDITKQWMKGRIDKGLDGKQGVPGFVYGFLDDYWLFLAGEDRDVEQARLLIIMCLSTWDSRCRNPNWKPKGHQRRQEWFWATTST